MFLFDPEKRFPDKGDWRRFISFSHLLPLIFKAGCDKGCCLPPLLPVFKGSKIKKMDVSFLVARDCCRSTSYRRITYNL